MHWFVLLFVAIFASSSVQAEDLSVEEIMSPQEQESSGVDRMSPQQRQALERWITGWTERVLSQSSTYHQSLTIPQWVAKWPRHLLPKPISEKQSILEKREANQTIYRNKNGEVLELHDGSVWAVNSIDSSVARWWKRGDRLQIRKAKYDIARPYILYNESCNQQAGAKLTKPANAEGERPPERAEYYRGAFVLSSISLDGTEVALKNGSYWEISPMYQLQIMSTWTVGDRIKVEFSGDTMYRYRLINLDSGDSVLGNQRLARQTK